MVRALDISFRKSGLERELSNLTERPFTLGRIEFGSMEGFLQSLKRADADWIESVRLLHGVGAWKRGQEGNDWKERQTLWFRHLAFPRQDHTYQQLLKSAYDAQYEQNPRFGEALRETCGCALTHDIGKTDPRDTVLTQFEYIDQLYRLRWRALDEQ